jgi:hypothetical protein
MIYTPQLSRWWPTMADGVKHVMVVEEHNSIVVTGYVGRLGEVGRCDVLATALRLSFNLS